MRSRKLFSLAGCAGASVGAASATLNASWFRPWCLSSVRAESTLKQEYRPVIILGSGPAGLTAALYTARANLNPLVLEGEQSGGQLTTTTEVENFPGFPSGVDGNELIDGMKEQSARFGTEFRFESVSKVDFNASNDDDGRPKTMSADSKGRLKLITRKTEYSCDACIIATGASAMYLGLPNELALIGHGVSACATCDGFFFKDKEVAVVGGGDTAMEEALFLTKFASKVTIIHRRGELRASQIMQDRAMSNPKIEFQWHSVVSDVYGTTESGVTGLQLTDTRNGKVREMNEIKGLFLGIGHKPNTDFLSGVSGITLDKDGYIVTDYSVSPVHTGVEGVYACGDCMDKHYRQAVTAAGTGCMAAIDAERYLSTLPE